MNKTKSLLLTLMVCAFGFQYALAQPTCTAPDSQFDLTFDVSGMDSYGAFDDPNNVVINLCNIALANRELTHVSWDNFLVSPASPSWCSEAVVAIGPDITFTAHDGENFPGPCTPNSSGGTISFADIFIPPPVADANGCIAIQLFETFDDGSVAPDGVWVSGSMTLSGCGLDPATVPTLGEWGLIILGLFIMIAGVLYIRTSRNTVQLAKA